MGNQKPEGFHFPFTFTLRAMGEDRDDFAGFVLEIIQRHAPEVKRDVVMVRPSREGKYISVLVTFTARDRAQLDDIYRSLSEQKRVLMVL
jgi:putative lipoic acid-binding regulatory protein